MGQRGGREAQEGGDICTHMGDSDCCAAEANTTLQSNHSPIKNKLKNIFKSQLSSQSNLD